MTIYTFACLKCGSTFNHPNKRTRLCGECAVAKRFCEECWSELPTSSQVNKRFCNMRCLNVRNARVRDRDAFRASHKAWRDATLHVRQAARIEACSQRTCVECGIELRLGCRKDKQFCSQRCTNQASLRNHVEERNESSRKRSRLLIGPGVSKADWLRLCNRHQNRCSYCGTKGRMTMDHIVPVSRGGWHAIGNITPACRGCNSTKKARFLVELRHLLRYTA